MKSQYAGPERRQFIRLDYIAPLAYKICSKKTISRLMEGYTADISAAGLLCSIKDKVNSGDILWLAFDRGTLNVCEDIEKRCLIYQNGIIGKVVRAKLKEDNAYEVGVQFLTREEKNLTHIYPKIHFLKLDATEVFDAEQNEKDPCGELIPQPKLETQEEKQEE